MSLIGLLLETTVKSSLVVLAALVAVACLRRGSAALRHWILSAAIVAAIVSPVLGLVTPSWHVPLDAIAGPQLIGAVAPSTTARGTAQPAAASDRREDATSRSMAGAAAVVSTAWLAGAGAGVVLLLIGLGRLTWIASTARRVDDGPWAVAAGVPAAMRSPRPVVISRRSSPLLVTWGFAQPKVILPRAIRTGPGAIRVVLARARAHQAATG